MAVNQESLTSTESPQRWWPENSDEAWLFAYEKWPDTLYASPGGKAHAAVSESVQDVILRVDPATGEIYGFEIEGFETSFLKKHPEYTQGWPRIRYPSTSKAKRRRWLDALIQYVRSVEAQKANRPAVSA